MFCLEVFGRSLKYAANGIKQHATLIPCCFSRRHAGNSKNWFKHAGRTVPNKETIPILRQNIGAANTIIINTWVQQKKVSTPRNEGLYRLREIDDELRTLEPRTTVNGYYYDQVLDERQCIVEALVVMNCEPWPFEPDFDNSFIVGVL